jgi:hypothetical protein
MDTVAVAATAGAGGVLFLGTASPPSDLGSQLATASQYGLAFADGLEAGGVVPVVKHFPGLGGSSGNTDDGPAQTLPYATLQQGGLIPF